MSRLGPPLLCLLAVLLSGCSILNAVRAASPAEVERFGNIDLPTSTRDLDAELEKTYDGYSILRVSFALDRADLRPLLKSGDFQGYSPRTQAGFIRGMNPAGTQEPQWSLESASTLIGHTEGLRGRRPARAVTVVLDEPESPVFYMRAIIEGEFRQFRSSAPA